jgi:hypothetical protein
MKLAMNVMPQDGVVWRSGISNALDFMEVLGSNLFQTQDVLTEVSCGLR